MPTGSYEHPLLGHVTFKTKSSSWVRGDPITFTSGFDPKTEIEDVQVPQLAGVPGAGHGRFPFHVRGHAQLQAAFADLEKQGLLSQIKSFGGGFVPRLRRPTDGSLSKLPSNHAFGLAIDINPDDGTNGSSAGPLAPVLSQHGFLWGQVFHDPMHFEVRVFQPFVPRSVSNWSSPPHADLSNLVREHAALFTRGLRHLELDVRPDGGFRLCLDGVDQTAVGAFGALHLRGEQLSYQKVAELVNKYNKCPGVTTELLTALIWKESSFRPDAENSDSSATGLMMVTKIALNDVNANTPPGVHFEHSEMTDPAKNIQCGSFYLGMRIKRAGGKLKEGLEGYGTGKGYADNILACEKCLLGKPANPQDCLNQIHTISLDSLAEALS